MAKAKKSKKGAEEGGRRERKGEIIRSGGPTPAEIVEIVDKIGTKQGGKQVRCKLLDGREAGKVMRRNVLGPTRVGDIIMLMETEIEARQMGKGRRG